jgi:hypothetical protein
MLDKFLNFAKIWTKPEIKKRNQSHRADSCSQPSGTVPCGLLEPGQARSASTEPLAHWRGGLGLHAAHGAGSARGARVACE